ncbi:MAG: sulfotransferase [Pirellulaceae bacterium]
MCTPNFFLVGAPRCGTTAMFRWLRRHPHVFLPALKECHYLATDFGRFRSVQTEEQYRRLFCEVRDEHVAVGEASVMYLYSSVAIENILDRYPQATILVALRNPLELVYSWHGQLLVTMQEDQADFEEAWLRQADRIEGRSLPPHCTVPQALHYSQMGRLGTQVQRLLNKCDRRQVHFVIYDDLVRDVRATYEQLLQALGVAPAGAVSLEVVNQNRAIPSAVLRKLWFRSPAVVGARRRMRSVCGDRIYERVRDALMPRLIPARARPPLSPRLRQMLTDEFREDVCRLSDLLHRDFRHWLAA